MAYEAKIARKAIKDSGKDGPLVIVAGPAAPFAEQNIKQVREQGAKAIVSFGVCGALETGLMAGQVVLPKAILEKSTHPSPYPNAKIDLNWRDRLQPVLEQNYFITSSPLLSVDHPIMSAKEKQALHAQTDACAVDMESGKLAAQAQAHGLPFIAVRVVGDTADQTIPQAFEKVLTKDGDISVFELIKGLITKWPGLQTIKALSNNDAEARSNLAGLTKLALPNFKLPI